MMHFIDVIIPLPIKSTFTYSINKDEFNFINPGFRVMVPFGKSKFTTGIVIQKHHKVPVSYEPKEIEFIIDKEPCVTQSQLIFFKWISEYYMTPIGQVIKVALPKLLLLKSESEIILLKQDISDFNVTINSKFVFDFQFNSANGQISGTPSILLSRTQYTIWGNNSGGHSVAYVNVTINDVSPNTIVYSSHDLTLEKGTAMTTTTPAISGGSVTSWEISPSIPAGMAFSASTGAISGTPTGLQTTAVAYTIWANNSGGWTSTEMNITINDQAASITYPATVEVSNDRTMTTVTPTNTGGAVPTWEIHPSLPSSLNFGSSNGSIWGTPTGLLENVTYTVFTNNSGGSTNTTFTLGLNWTLTPSVEGVLITRNTSSGTDITWEWDYDPLEAQNLSLVTGE